MDDGKTLKLSNFGTFFIRKKKSRLAGMAADLFETYAVTIVATMVLSSIFFQGDMSMMIYPLSIGGDSLEYKRTRHTGRLLIPRQTI